MAYLLDTNIVTYILKRNQIIDSKIRELRRLKQDIFISCITYYEIKRGLLAINATRQLVDFKQFCEFYPVLLIDDLEIIETACKIQVDLKSRGHRLEDADILIAATAIARGLILVSHDSDLQRIQELTIKLAIIAVVNILNAHATYRKISTSAPLLTASSARCKTSSLTTALK